jgi:hypothetical protein
MSVLLLTGCPEQPNPLLMPPPAPRVSLTLASQTIIAPTIKGRVTTSGCQKVGQVQILESGSFLADAVYKGEPTDFELSASLPLLQGIYPRRGFSTELSLTAKVICEDTAPLPDGGFSAREGTSQPSTVNFLPVQSVRQPPGGAGLALPDSFVAEGGIGNQPTTFIGCTATDSGTAVVRVDQNGNILAVNNQLPFPCDFASGITAANRTTDRRWLWSRQQGAVALDSNLNITSSYLGFITRLIVGPDGDAIVFDEDTTAATPSAIVRLAATRPNPQTSVRWRLMTSGNAGYPGFMISDPVISQGKVFTTSFQRKTGQPEGLFVTLAYNYDNGQLLTPSPAPAFIRQTFPDSINREIVPGAAQREDGLLVYVALLSVNNQTGAISTSVVACASTETECVGPNRRWTSPAFPGQITTLVSYSAGNFIAAAGPFGTYFLNASDGAVRNLAAQPSKPGGTLFTMGVQPGKGTDFFLLNGPVPPQGQIRFPTEIVAVDAPDRGEVWRVAIEGGTSPTDSLYVAVDDNGQAWMRIGREQIRPFRLDVYRMQRGATAPPNP